MSIPALCSRSVMHLTWIVSALAVPALLAGQDNEPRLGPKEAAIEAALAQETELNFTDALLSDVVDFLRQKHEIQIQLDAKGLADAGVGSDTIVTRNIHDIKLCSALDLLLGELDLTFVIRDEVLLITTKTEAENMLSTRVYPVADLVTPQDEDLVVSYGSDFSGLMEMITSTLEPDTWDETGGPGTIKKHRKSQSLVISQTYEVHREISELLESLRAVDRRQAAQRRDAPAPTKGDDALQLKVYRLPAKWLVANVAPAAPTSNPIPAALQPQPGAAPAAKPDEPKPGTPPDAPHRQMVGASLPATGARHPSAADLAEAIPELIEPASWNCAGGTGTIRALGGTLVVLQTASVHAQIRRLLQTLNEI